MIKQSIAIKLTALILIISVTPLLILASYSYLEKTQAETTRVKELLTHVVESGIDTVTDEIEGVKTAAQAIATLKDFTNHSITIIQDEDTDHKKTAAQELQEDIATATRANNLFREAYVRAPNGTLILSSNIIPPAKTLTQETSFPRALRGETTISEIILSKEPARNEQGEFEPELPLLFVSTPINYNGKVAAILTFRVDINSLFPPPTRYLENTKTGEQFILNEEGYFISHTKYITNDENKKNNHQLKLRATNAKTGSLSPLFLLSKHNETTINLKGYQDYRGTTVVGAARKIPGTDWTYIAKIDKTEAFKELNSLQNFLLIELALSITLIIIISALAGKYATKPFATLIRATEALKRRQFGFRTRIQTHDEFEDLSQAFNKAAQQLGKTEAERKQIDKAKTQFLSITSHELRSPMTPIRAQLQLLTSGAFGKLKPKQKTSVETVLRNANHLDNILKDFLDISRIEAGRLKLNIKKTDLRNLILETVKLNEGHLPKKNITITTNIPKIPSTHTDPDRITQVITNLITNALKFSYPNTTIHIAAQNLPNHVLISVKDQGIGITPKDQQKLFQPFTQAEQGLTRKHGGTGLGLAISKGILSALGGRIWLESKTGKGTTFYFTIPKKTPQAKNEAKSIFNAGEDTAVERLFADIWGKRGATDYARLQKTGRLDQKTLIAYVREKEKSGKITQENARELKKKINETK